MKMLIGFCLVCLPLKHLKINSGYGYRVHPITGDYAMHSGVDLKARHDTVFAIMDGIVDQTGYDRFLGIHIRLKHDGNITSVYGHLSQIWVAASDSVSAGEPIGITGATGRVTGEHLHFSICYQNRAINPINFLYKLLINKQNEQKFQSPASPAFRQADR
jgi:murein DD-endopeptidase MepM/ murein hydrolase activator NlpD